MLELRKPQLRRGNTTCTEPKASRLGILLLSWRKEFAGQTNANALKAGTGLIDKRDETNHGMATSLWERQFEDDCRDKWEAPGEKERVP